MRGATWRPIVQVMAVMLACLPIISSRELAPGAADFNPLFKILQDRSKNNTILMTIGTGGYLDMLKNMACRLDQLDIQNYVVGALDPSTILFCEQHEIPFFTLDDLKSTFSVSHPYAMFNTNEFRMIVRQKQLALAAMLGMGFRVLVVDLDVFVLRSPFEYIESLPLHDFAMQSGCRMYMMPYEWLNAGFMMVNPTPRSIKALGTIMERTDGGKVREAQAFNDVLCGLGAYNTSYSSCAEPESNATTLVLEQSLFLGGDVFFQDLTPEVALLASPFMVHFSHFRYGAKQLAMKGIGMWVAGESLETCETFSVVREYDKDFIHRNLQPSHVNVRYERRTMGQWFSALIFGLWDVWLLCLVLGCCIGKCCCGKSKKPAIKKKIKGRLE